MTLPVVLVVASLFPSFFVWRRERRKRKLAEARLQIAESVTQMETLMLAGTIKMGDCCHDDMFGAMCTAQRLDRFPMRWNFFKRESDTERQMRGRLSAELRDGDPEVAAAVSKFVNGYYRAFRYSHPYLSRFYYWYLVVLRFGLVGIREVLGGLLKLMTAMKRTGEFRQSFGKLTLSIKKFRQSAKKAVVARCVTYQEEEFQLVGHP